METESLTFGWPDYLVFGGIMFVCTLIGLVQGIRDKWGLKKKDQANGQEGDMKLLPVVWSIVATSFSSNFVLGFPAEMYFIGTEFGVICIGFAIGFPTSIFLFLKKFYELQIPSVFDYIGLRFGKEMKATIVSLYALAMLLYMGLIIYAPALAFTESSTLNLFGAILVTGMICILYTTLGGLKGVIWIDTLMMMIVLAIGVANCAYGTHLVGGFSTVWETAINGSRIEFTSFSADPLIRHSFWSCTVGGIAVVWLLTTNQAVTQKFLALPKITEMYIAGGIYCVAVIAFCCVYMMMGVVIYAYYKVVGCEPSISKEIDRADQLVPYFVLDVYRNAPGVAGLFIAGVYGASLSTVSAGINALAALTMRDIVFPIYKKKGALPSPKQRVILFKGLSVLWGLIAMAIAFVAPLMGRSVLQIGLSILSMASGPIVGLIILGMYIPFAEKIGAFAGVICAIVIEFTFLIGASIYPTRPSVKVLTPGNCLEPNVTDAMTSAVTMTTTSAITALTTTQAASTENTASAFFRVSYLLYSPFGILITIIVCMVVSLCVRCIKGQVLWPEIDAKLLHLSQKAKMSGREKPEMIHKEPESEINGAVPSKTLDEEKAKLESEMASELRQTSDLPMAASIAFAHQFSDNAYDNAGFDTCRL